MLVHSLILFFVYLTNCQVQITPLNLNTQLRDTVQEFRWKFYSFTTNANAGFIMNVVHSQDYDLDLYIRKGSQVPDRFNNYDYKDSGLDPNLTIVGNVLPAATLYTAGVFCFRGVSVPFTISVVSGNGCPNSCSGNGQCVNGACTCNEGWSGAACNVEARTDLLPGVEFGPFTLDTGKWKMFRFTVQTTESLQIAVTQTVPRGDIDTYAQYGALPTLTNYRYANIEPYNANKPTHVINMTSPDIGEWFVGCYAYAGSTFKIKLNAARGCSDNCSDHGSCIGSRCSCTRNYFGTYCESYRPNMALTVDYTGFVGVGSWNYYKATAAGSLNTLMFDLRTRNASESCDIYVNENSNPTQTNYTFHEVTNSNQVARVIIPSAGDVIHHIGIYGSRACHYTVKAHLERANESCSASTCVHGTCVNGLCDCATGYSGVKCDQSDVNLVNGVTSQGNVSNNQWVYYNYTFRDTTQFVIVVKELNTSGLMHLYFAYNTAPTLATYILKEIGTTSLHRVAVTFSARTREFNVNNTLTFIIGIYGTSSIPGGRALPFKIVAWNPPF